MTSTTGAREIVVCRDDAELAGGAAGRIAAASQEAISQRGRFTLVLSGGSTPERTYARLAQLNRPARVDWSRTTIFFGDERCVPHDDPRSNYHMAKDTLLTPARIDLKRVLPVATNVGTPVECAAAYEGELRKFFEMPAGGTAGEAWPKFDLILLGLGDDGHTASLFPGKPTLKEMKAWVTWSPPGVLPPPVDRVTFTFPLLNAARQIMFLVSGAGKATMVREILENHPPVEKHPAVGVRPRDGKVIWMLDEAAGKLLKKNL